ncbi:MAG TPA: sigma-70 family RNA polymerase sigma factor [Gaiellales bacterium]|nr:sigma-70 family RNA polymerase sigma factor [Gaiellales bacterium]
MNPDQHPPEGPEARFRRVFAHLQPVADYAARRGSSDPEAIAAETMAIAWRRLDRVPVDDPRPWLFVTARNLLMAERRRSSRRSQADRVLARPEAAPAVESADPAVTRALRALPERDREALLLVAWEDLTPAQAAEALGIAPVAFRVRLLRARRRFARSLAADGLPNTPDVLEVKST